MELGIIAVRYAKALLKLAKEKNQVEQVASEIQQIGDILAADNGLTEYLNNPIVKAEHKKKLLNRLFYGKVQKIVSSFLELLINKKREKYLSGICLSFYQEYRKYKGLREILITTAVPVEGTILNQLSKKVTENISSEVVMRTVVDKDIIGGFVLKIDDLQLDKSIANQLSTIKQELLENN